MASDQPTTKARRIVQIAACGHENTQSTQSNWTLFALDDQGVLWEYVPTAPGWGCIRPPTDQDLEEKNDA